MRNLLALVIFLLVSCSKSTEQQASTSSPDVAAFEESDLEVYPYGKDSFDWKSVEKEVPDEIRRQFVDTIGWFEAFYGEEGYKNVHVIDLNADGVDDYILSCGPYDEYCIIKVDSFYFQASFNIVDLKMEEGKLSKLYTGSTISTAGPAIDGQEIYEVSFNGTGVQVKQTFGSMLSNFVNPRTWYNPYKLYQINSDTKILRWDPEIVNAPANDFFPEINGNQLGVFRNGTEVNLIGEIIDMKGEKWYFVLFPDGSVTGYPMYERKDKKIYYTGWIKL